jgi:hypothetical protein
MMARKCKKDVVEIWNQIKKGTPEVLYKLGGDNLFKYVGYLKDEPDKLIMEYVCEILLNEFGILKEIGSNPKNLRKSKPFIKRSGISNSTLMLDRYGHIRCDENKIGMALYNSDYKFPFGKIDNYQLSIKESKIEGSGPIDLIAYNDNEIGVIELKTSKSNSETLLRAIMESFTFVILLINIKEKFTSEFNINNSILFRPLVISFKDIRSCAHMELLENDRLPNLKALIKKMNEHLSSLDILSFKFYSFESELPRIIQDKSNHILFEKDIFIRHSGVKLYKY